MEMARCRQCNACFHPTLTTQWPQWEEFTEFLIEAGMVSREEMSVDAVKKYYASPLQDNTRHDDVMNPCSSQF